MPTEVHIHRRGASRAGAERRGLTRNLSSWCELAERLGPARSVTGRRGTPRAGAEPLELARARAERHPGRRGASRAPEAQEALEQEPESEPERRLSWLTRPERSSRRPLRASWAVVLPTAARPRRAGR